MRVERKRKSRIRSYFFSFIKRETNTHQSQFFKLF